MHILGAAPLIVALVDLFLSNMISGYSRWFRLVLILVLTGAFLSIAYLIFQKQQQKFSFTSFHVPQERAGVFIPNVDRLRKKITSADQLLLEQLPQVLEEAINGAIQNQTFRFSEKLSSGCFISYNTTDFLVAFQTTNVDASDIADMLISDFLVSSTFSENQLAVSGRTYQVNQYNHFLVISTCTVAQRISKHPEHFGNADFVVFLGDSVAGDHHILDNGSHHIVKKELIAGPQGKPLLHESFLNFVPSGFTQLSFYGSSRFDTDMNFFFNQPEKGILTWADGGMILLQKDSFELLIAPQNSETDLKLLLEEETLLSKGDTSTINYFNIGPYRIMPFETSLSWKKSISSLTDDFRFFTEIENYNVLANSIPAMRWYLGEIQLGNLLTKNTQLNELYRTSLPQRAHTFHIVSAPGKTYELSNKIWTDPSTCIASKSISQRTSTSSEAAKLYASFNVELVPTAIGTLKDRSVAHILVSNNTEVALYDTSGIKLWHLQLSSPLTGKPQIADIENDGSEEVVLFQTDQLNIVDAAGNSKTGLPKKYGGLSNGGIVVNYDNSFNYRFLTSIGNQIKSLDEQGNAVQGWMFNSMTSTLQGAISYYVTQGKDMISFKDNNNKQYVINRRGESRLTKEVSLKLPNESTFVVGNYEETSLRKLGYQNNYIYNVYLLDGQKDSVKLDRAVNALTAYWIFNNNQPLLVIEESERVVVIDEFGYEKESVLKPIPNQQFAGLVIGTGFRYVFVDNSENGLYLLDGYGKMIFPLPVLGSSVFHLSDNLLYTLAGSRINVYKTE